MWHSFLVYLLLILLLFGLINLYFFIAKKAGIVDVPNNRSSHNRVTLRGGGVIFYLALILFFLFSKFDYPLFFIGISIISIVSFIDDIKPIRFYFRMGAQFLALGLMFQELGFFSNLEVWAIASLVVLSVGIVNTYNFMDGINGITGLYSLITLITLWAVNKWIDPFVDGRLIAFIGVSVGVFLVYNFRSKAKCFAGDVGAVTIAYIIIFLIFKLMLDRDGFNLIYLLFLAVYGVDSVGTILIRLLKRENIFEAHRSHLYQVMVHKAGYSHLKVATWYAMVQLIINVLIISVSDELVYIQILFSIGLLLLLALLYVVLKIRFLKSILA